MKAMDRFQQIRLLEAIIFASAEPVAERVLAERLPEGKQYRGVVRRTPRNV